MIKIDKNILENIIRFKLCILKREKKPGLFLVTIGTLISLYGIYKILITNDIGILISILGIIITQFGLLVIHAEDANLMFESIDPLQEHLIRTSKYAFEHLGIKIDKK